MAPPYACHSCAAHAAVVFCFNDAAALCVHCDAAAHGLHRRAPLCDLCGAAPAAVRCDASFMICAGCRPPPAGNLTGGGVAQYTGYPSPAELVRLLSVEAPPQRQEEFDAWLANQLLLIDDDDPPIISSGTTCDDVTMAVAKIEKLLAGYGPVSTDEDDDQMLFPPPAADQTTTPQQQSITMTEELKKKREERERAKLRYWEKKKNRSFCKQIMYASRKVRADERKRVKGRFAKASDHSASSHD